MALLWNQSDTAEQKPPGRKQCRENLDELVKRAEEINNAATGENREPTAEEQDEFDRLINAEIPAAKRALAIAEAKFANQAGEVLEKRREQEGSKPQFTFRDAVTGEIVHALSPEEKLTPVGTNECDEILNDGTKLPRIGETLHAMLTGRGDLAQIQNAIGSSDSAGGYILTPTLSGIVIDLARSASVAMRAGAITIPVGSSELNLVRVDGDPTGYWRPEGVEVLASDVQFGRVTLRPKTLAAVVPVSIELLEDAANAASLIESSLQSALGLMLDQAVLTGSGAESHPLGITNHESVNKVLGVGTPTNYAQVSQAVGQILQANYSDDPDGLAWIMHPRDGETYDGLTATDNQPLMPTPWAGALQRLSTTSMPTELGGGSNESQMIVGDFSQCAIGMRTGITIRILDSGTVTDSAGTTYNAVSELRRFIVAYMRADVALLRPTWFSVLSGVTNS